MAPVIHPPRDESGVRRLPLNTLASKAAGDPGDPSPILTPTLFAALQRYRATTAAEVTKAAPTEDVEAKALRKSRKRLHKHLGEGVSPARAAVLAHLHYRKHHGKSGIDVWSKKVAEGR